MCLFIHYTHEDRSYFISPDLQARLAAFVAKPPAAVLESSETLEESEGRVLSLCEREAQQEFVIMLRTIEQTRVQVSEITALPSAAALQALTGNQGSECTARRRAMRTMAQVAENYAP